MTTYSKSTLKTFFETGDVPSGTDYANFIDSYVNIVDTAEQTMAGPLTTTQLNATLVSATNANVTSVLSAASLNVQSGLSVSCDVSAPSNVIYASAAKISFSYHGTPLIVSAAGTAQATGAPLTAEFCRLQGATDGQTTGFRILANQTGWVQYLSNECTVSANLWPPTGGSINGLGANTAFPLAANVPYIVMHRTASAYAVK